MRATRVNVGSVSHVQRLLMLYLLSQFYFFKPEEVVSYEKCDLNV